MAAMIDAGGWLLAIGIAILLFLLALTVVVALYHFGLFHPIQVSTGVSPFQYGDRSIWYRVGHGSYADSSVIFTELCSILPPGNGDTNNTTFGIYLPNGLFGQQIREKINQQQPELEPGQPEFVYAVGAIMDREVDPQTMQLLEQNGYRQGQLPPQADHVVYCQFPFRGNISVVVGSRRVYPSIHEYIEEHRLCAYPKIEIYHGDQIYYILPLSQQAGFLSLISAGLPDIDTGDLAGAAAAAADEPREEDNGPSELPVSEKGDHDGEESSDGSQSSYEMIDN